MQGDVTHLKKVCAFVHVRVSIYVCACKHLYLINYLGQHLPVLVKESDFQTRQFLPT